MCFCLGTAIAGAFAFSFFCSATLRIVHTLIPLRFVPRNRTRVRFSYQRRSVFRISVPGAEALPRIHGLVNRMVSCLLCSR